MIIFFIGLIIITISVEVLFILSAKHKFDHVKKMYIKNINEFRESSTKCYTELLMNATKRWFYNKNSITAFDILEYTGILYRLTGDTKWHNILNKFGENDLNEICSRSLDKCRAYRHIEVVEIYFRCKEYENDHNSSNDGEILEDAHRGLWYAARWRDSLEIILTEIRRIYYGKKIPENLIRKIYVVRTMLDEFDIKLKMVREEVIEVMQIEKDSSIIEYPPNCWWFEKR